MRDSPLAARAKVLALPLRAEVLTLPRAQVLELALCAEVLTLPLAQVVALPERKC